MGGKKWIMGEKWQIFLMVDRKATLLHESPQDLRPLDLRPSPLSFVLRPSPLVFHLYS